MKGDIKGKHSPAERLDTVLHVTLCPCLKAVCDLRAKAGTDKTEISGDICNAQKQLGHTRITMTEHYVRNCCGAKVAPTK